MSMKASVPLGLVRPSGQNPRRDFGDIGALARTIEATGGQPVNPIVVVEDGETAGGEPTYRIVDGERRYRALVELGSEEADVLIFRDWAAAEEAVAMLATDDKRALTPEERARGFQSMLALGVSDEVAGAAARVDPAVVRRVRRVAHEAPEQTTLDAMIAASEFDDPGERARVLSARDPDSVALVIRREHEEAEARAAVRSAVEAAGAVVDWREGEPAPSRTAVREDDLVFLVRLSSERDVRFVANREGLVAWPKGSGWDVWSPRSQPGDGESSRTSERERAEGLIRASRTAVAEMKASVMKWIAGQPKVPHDVASLVRAHRRDASYFAGRMGVPEGDSDLATALDSDPSPYEALDYVAGRGCTYGIRTWDGSFSSERAAVWQDLWSAAVQGGWDPASCPDAAAELEAFLRESEGGES